MNAIKLHSFNSFMINEKSKSTALISTLNKTFLSKEIGI